MQRGPDAAHSYCVFVRTSVYFMYESKTSLTWDDRRSCTKPEICLVRPISAKVHENACKGGLTFPPCRPSASLRYWPTHAFTSVISGHGSLMGFLHVFSGVNPTPKLKSSISASGIIASSATTSTGGTSRSLSKASHVKPQPFL